MSWLTRTCTVGFWVMLCVSGAHAAITVTLVPADPTIEVVGQTVEVDLVADIPESTPVVGWGMDLVVENGALGWWLLKAVGPDFVAVHASDGDELAGLVPPPDGVWGSQVLLATIELTGTAPGTTALLPGDSNPDDLTEGFMVDPDAGGGYAEVTYVPGVLTVLPEPGSAALLLAAAGLLIRRRK